jgi:hypothetical protein
MTKEVNTNFITKRKLWAAHILSKIAAIFLFFDNVLYLIIMESN